MWFFERDLELFFERREKGTENKKHFTGEVR